MNPTSLDFPAATACPNPVPSAVPTRLLISVRNVAEATAALEGGAELLDIKEPRHGSLGRADARVWSEIRDAVGPRCPLSVAVGEITDDNILSHAARVGNVRYAKLGLAGAPRIAEWRSRWRAVTQQFPSGVQPVAVIYADWRSAAAPLPSDILCQAADLGCRMVLVDTFHKRRGSLFRILSPYQLDLLVQQVRRRGLGLVLAGSLTLADIARARQWEPDWIAIRGAACEGGRSGRVTRELVQRLSSRLA
jgi:(5-formylfuran-3-yl)methyl phosphate synthase